MLGYMFADKYGISILRALALDRTLTYFTLFSKRIGDVLALARYYSQESDDE